MFSYKLFIIVIVGTMPQLGISQIFKPQNFEDCIIDALKKTKTESATPAIKKACSNKFPNSNDGIVRECNLTWDGKKFYKGTPQNEDRYVAVRFTSTASMIFMPGKMNTNLIKNTITNNKSKILDICPNITFD
jgi:hypothetical protein